MHIPLDQIAPGLAQKLERVPVAKSRRIVAQACVFASTKVLDWEPPVRELLNAILTVEGLSESQAAEARELAAEADNRYLILKDQGAHRDNWSTWFMKARLLTALAHAGKGGGMEDILDAVYELCFACDDPSDVLGMIESAIRD